MGGLATIEIIDANGKLQKIPHIGGGEPFSLINGHHYDCAD